MKHRQVVNLNICTNFVKKENTYHRNISSILVLEIHEWQVSHSAITEK